MAADLTIVNDGTLDDLREQVTQVLNLLEARGA
jgi:dephospho-CoA kinase